MPRKALSDRTLPASVSEGGGTPGKRSAASVCPVDVTHIVGTPGAAVGISLAALAVSVWWPWHLDKQRDKRARKTDEQKERKASHDQILQALLF